MPTVIDVTVTEDHPKLARRLIGRLPRGFCCPNALAICDALGLPSLARLLEAEEARPYPLIGVTVRSIYCARDADENSIIKRPPAWSIETPEAALAIISWFDDQGGDDDESWRGQRYEPAWPVKYQLEIPG